MASVIDFLVKLRSKDEGVTQAAQRIKRELVEVRQNAEQVGVALKKALSFDNFKSSLMAVPGMQFLMNPYTIIGAGIGAVTKLGAEAQMTATAFNILVGDEKKAADALAEIKEFANFTPYQTMDLVESAKQMMAFGVSTEKSIDLMKRLGDVAQGDANKMKSLSLVMAQVESLGHLEGGDFKQFVGQGFNPLQELLCKARANIQF